MRIRHAKVAPRDPLKSGKWSVEAAIDVEAGTADEALSKVARALRDDGKETTGLRLPTWPDARPPASKVDGQ
jgi:hypothetical protein